MCSKLFRISRKGLGIEGIRIIGGIRNIGEYGEYGEYGENKGKWKGEELP